MDVASKVTRQDIVRTLQTLHQQVCQYYRQLPSWCTPRSKAMFLRVAHTVEGLCCSWQSDQWWLLFGGMKEDVAWFEREYPGALKDGLGLPQHQYAGDYQI